jgi:hypothetical protein
MPIPDFPSLLLPLLQYAADGTEHTTDDAAKDLAIQFNLSEQERKERHPKKDFPRFTNQVTWARAHLTMAGLQEARGEGVFRNTLRGQQVLANNPQVIDIPFLKQFPEYVEANNKTKKQHDTPLALNMGKQTPKETERPPIDLPEPPSRYETQILRIIRDTKLARELKSQYGFACQVCGLRIEPTHDSFYVEVHHVRPLGGGHDGLDTHSNMLVLCPNHHAMFDFGIPRFLSPQRIEIAGTAYDLTIKHALSPESIAYHNAKLHIHNVA